MKQCAITGAADGIGRALAHRFSQAGYAIIGLDVDVTRAEQTQAELTQAGGQASFIIANLAVETEVEGIINRLAEGPAIDVLIHNAGISAVGRFAASDLARQHAVLQLNLLAPMLLTAGLLGRQRVQGGGSLVFISSLSHFAGYPGAAVYAASKDGLASYARSLSVSLAPPDIQVLTVFPGPTRTAHARRYSPDNSREAKRMPPEELAAKIFRAVQSRQSRLVPGFGNRLFALMGHYFPNLAELAMRKIILDKLDEMG